jgi:Tfp pilus assembly protein PilX
VKFPESTNSSPATALSILNSSGTNERGAALIIVLVMLLLLTILGATLLSSSTTDLQIAGNYRNNQKAFYINDYAFELLKTSDSEVNVYRQSNLTQAGNSRSFSSTIPATGETVDYTVTNVGCLGGAPAGSGGDADSSNYYNIYEIEITGRGPNNANVTSLTGNLYQRSSPCE